ncbi:MAG: DUF2087 domain-containing protein [Chloroflexi bacterium]|nr:DUF2087 domain-containing protein [Chloroflexota bacterium]
MDAQSPNMLDFVKATSDADRLRVVGVLARGAANAETVAAELQIPFRDALNHLAFLRFVGIVRTDTGDIRQSAVYELNPGGAEAIAKARLPGTKETYAPAPHLDGKSRKALAAFLNADGSIRQIPNSRTQPEKLKVIFDYLVEAFEPGVDYTEREVNTIIRRFHEDTAGLRRDLVDAGLLGRVADGSRYWRVAIDEVK